MSGPYSYNLINFMVCYGPDKDESNAGQKSVNRVRGAAWLKIDQELEDLCRQSKPPIHFLNRWFGDLLGHQWAGLYTF